MSVEIDQLIERCKTFTLAAYKELLQYLMKKYTIIPFRDWDYTAAPKLALRHDIDGHITDTARTHNIELELRIKATYFVMMSSQFYNPFEWSDMIELLATYHEVGLHLNKSLYYTEYTALKQLIGEEIQHYSIHNYSLQPPRKLSYQAREPRNAYNPKFTQCYVSDSKRTWNEGDLRKLLEGQQKAQLLIHPCLWTEQPMTTDEWYDWFFEERKKNLDRIKEEWRVLWK